MPRGPVLPSDGVTYLTSSLGVLAEIGATSKALRTTEYDDAGLALRAQPIGAYLLPIEILHTGTPAAGTLVWAIRNGTTNAIHVRRVHLEQSFHGTAAAATLRYSLCRFTGANPATGTTLTAIKKRSAYPASTLQDARFLETGLTVAGISFETALATFGLPISVTCVREAHDFQFGDVYSKAGGFELAASEGFGIRIATVATVIGSGLTGFVEIEERAL